ncbi:putative DsbA family dithiol-disulfide isomerase [Aureibacillus halotolerans]|uniref:Putative DsbA family dithiol-disulfide isomerase n=2 Tax=Aureibacillus halotolerans TaxID=1508390 RepID=A0A4R6TRP8_9BACI|nr:putative DsbA family dithiol-disulfide isomerase [Aureibacillus halotolerans]
MVKVDIWSDVACPFCYIGKRNFERGVQMLEGEQDIEVNFRSFQLDPSAPVTTKDSVHDMLVKKYGMPLAQAKEMNQNVTQTAKQAGLRFDLDNVVLTNTMDAHRLSHFAKQQGKMNDVIEALLCAYFVEGKHVGDLSVLASIGEQAGLDKNAVRDMLAGHSFKAEVNKDQEDAKAIGMTGVPFFVINDTYAVSGAQPPEVFANALRDVTEKEKLSQDAVCTDAHRCE